MRKFKIDRKLLMSRNEKEYSMTKIGRVGSEIDKIERNKIYIESTLNYKM